MPGATSVGHVALKVKDIDRSMAFYSGVMGFPEMLPLHHDDGSLFLIYLRVTNEQYVELFPDADSDHAPGIDANGVHHFCLTVEKLEPFIEAIAGRGAQFSAWQKDGSGLAKVPTAQISNGLDGNRQAWLEDPDGNRIELMEMAPDCLQYQAIRRLRAASAKPA